MTYRTDLSLGTFMGILPGGSIDKKGTKKNNGKL
jgi:hypothetical protein